MRSTVIKRAVLLVLCLMLIVSLFACSPRTQPFDDNIIIKNPSSQDPGETKTEVIDDLITFNEAVAGVKKAVQNTNNMKSNSALGEWFVIDTQIDYEFKDFLVEPMLVKMLTIIIKANINLLDNAQSELFFEYRDLTLPASEQLRFGVYYIAKSAYFDIGGEKFYTEEINLTEIGKLIAAPLLASGLDIGSMITGLITGDMGIELIDTILGVFSLFDTSDPNLKKKTAPTHKITRRGDGVDIVDYRFTLRLNDFLGIIKPGSLFGNYITWKTFKLPNLDPLLDAVLGVSLEKIKTKNWPQMVALFTISTMKSNKVPAVDQQGNILYDNEGNKILTNGYYFNGIKLDISTPISAKNTVQEYDLKLNATPFIFGQSDDKIIINFSNYTLGDTYKGTIYEQASLLNLEAEALFAVDSDDNGKVTLNSVLGSFIDLGAIGDIPLNFPAQATTYEFKINLKTHIDIFSYTGTRLEATIYFQGQPFLRVYFEGDELYINCSDLTDTNGQIIPNIKVSDFNINEMLAPILSSLEPMLNPDYVAPIVVPTDSPDNAGNEEVEEEAPSMVSLILDLIAANISNSKGPNGEDFLILYLDNLAINDLLKLLLGDSEGQIGITGLTFSVDKGSIFDSIKLKVELTDTVSARLNIEKFEYFKEPIFTNYEMIDTPAEQAEYIDIKNALMKYYGVTISGEFEFGMNETTGGVSFDGLMSALLGDIMLNLGVTEDANFVAGYKLQAALDFSDVTNSAMSINFYIEDPTNVFMMLYYDASEDTFYIDLYNFGRLKAELPALNILGELPRLKIENTGIRDMLTSISFFNSTEEPEGPGNMALAWENGYNITGPHNFLRDVFNGLFLGAGIAYNAAAAEEGGDSEGFDIMTLIGQGITVNIVDEIKALVINVDKQILTMLMGMLGVFAPMPDVNAFLKLQLIGVGTLGENDGYLKAYFAILDSALNDNGEYTDAIYIDLELIQKIKMTISDRRPEYFVEPFDPTAFVLLETFLEGLKIGIEVSGDFDLTSDSPTYTSDFIDSLVSGLIEGLSLRFGVDGFAMRLSYELKASISYNDILMLMSFINGETAGLPTALESELSLRLYDRDENQDVLGLYLKNNNIYLDVSYFGMPNISVNDTSLFINQLMLLLSTDVEEEPETAAKYSPLNALNGGLDDRIGLQIWLSADKISVELTKTMIAALMAMFIEGDLPVQFKDTAIEINLSDGVRFSLVTGVEVFDLTIKLNSIKLSVMGDEIPEIVLPQEDFFGTGSGLPQYLYVKGKGELTLHAEPDIEDGRAINKFINLTPALKALFRSLDLTAYLEMLGFVEGNIFLEVEASINMFDPVQSSVKVILSTGDLYNPANRTVVLVGYYEEGDLYIDTEIFGIGKLYIKDVDYVFTQLTSSPEESAPSNASAAFVSGGNYIDIMFVKGGITAQLVKNVLLAIFGALGVDMAPYLEGINELTIDAGFSINPIDISLGITADGIEMGFGLREIELAFNQRISAPDLTGYTTIEALETITVNLSGHFDFAILGSEYGTRFDYIIQRLRDRLIISQNTKIANGEMDPADAVDYESLLNFGILLQVLEDKFGGTLYYTIDANIDLLNLNNLNLALRISSLDVYNAYIETGDDSNLGDVMAFYIISEDGVLNAYLDAESLGIEKLKISDISGFISQLSSSGEAPLELPKNASGTYSDADVLAAHVLISITSSPENQYNGANVPILISVTEGAFFALLSSFGLDIAEFIGSYKPSAQVAIGGDSEFIAIRLQLQDLLNIEATIENPELKVNGDDAMYRAIAEDPTFYWFNEDEEDLNIKLTFYGDFIFSAEDTDEETAVDFTGLLRTFFTESEFGVLLENAGFGNKVIKYDIQARVNLSEILKGDMGLINGLEVLMLLTVLDNPSATTGQELSLYIKGGDLYADLSVLNAGKMRINNIFDIYYLIPSIPSETENAASPLNAAVYNLSEQLAAAFVTITLGNSSGLVLSVFTDVFKVVLNSFSLPGTEIGSSGQQLGDIIADTLNNNMKLEIGIGSGNAFEINIELANYGLSFIFKTIEIDFADSDVVFWTFDPDDYETIDKKLEFLHVSASIYLGWTMNEGAEYSLENLFESLSLINGLKIEPIISILAEISNTYRLDITANLNLSKLMDDTLSLNKRVSDSDLSIVMYDVSGGGEGNYVLSIYYVDGNLYLDAECFSIQKVKIVNAFDYLVNLYNMLTGITETVAPVVNSANDTPQNASLQNAVNPMAAYINLKVCPEGFVASLGSAALFAVFGMLGLDISNYIEPIGVIELEAALLSPTDILSLDFRFLSYIYDIDGNRIRDINGNYQTSDDYIGINLRLSNQYRISFKIGAAETIVPPANYLVIDNQVPIIGIKTKIAFEASVKEATFENLNQEPLSSIIRQMLEGFAANPEGDQTMVEYLKNLIITVFFQISDEQAARFELDILANINITNIQALEMQVIVNKMNGSIGEKILQINVYDGDLYLDLSKLGGPKVIIEDVLAGLFGGGEIDEPQNAGAPLNAGNESPNIKSLDLSVKITERGLFVYAYKAAFNALLNLFNLQNIAMFDYVEANAYIVPNNNALNIGFEFLIGTESEPDVIKIGLGLEGWNINFQAFGREQLIIPQSSNYIKFSDVNTVLLESTFELAFASEKGNISLSALYLALFGDSPLATTLPQKIILDDLGDTLVFDIKAIISIGDISSMLSRLQLRVNLYSKKAPEKFALDIAYYDNCIYIDATKIGLSKIKLDDISGLFAYFAALASGEELPEDTPEPMARFAARVREIESLSSPSNAEQQEQVACLLAILLSSDQGFFLTAAKDLIFVAFDLIGLDIKNYIDGVTEPEVKIGITPELSIEVGVKLKSALAGDFGALGLKMRFVTNKLKVGFANEVFIETPSGLESSILPLISKSERAEYINYDKLTVYADINISLTNRLKDGRISADNALGALFKLLGQEGALDTDIVFTGGDETLKIDIIGSLGINFEKLLSRDAELVKSATTAQLQLIYTIFNSDGTVYHSQQLAAVYYTDDIIYLTLDIMNSHINIRIPDINFSRVFTDLLGVTPGEEEPEPSEEEEEPQNAIDKLYSGLKLIGNGENPTMATLESVIRLNTQGFSLIVTKELLIALMEELSGMFSAVAESGETPTFDLSTLDFEAIFNDILDGASLGFYVDGENGGFSIRFNLFKEQEDEEGDSGASYPSAGYDIELSLLHNTHISTIRSEYEEFDNYLRNDPDLKKLYDSCFDSRDVMYRFTVSMDLILGADFMAYVLNWSQLFDLEEAESAFYLQVLEQLKGEITMSIKIDMLFTGLSDLMLDAMIRFINQDGDEVMALYFLGSLHQYDYPERGADPQLYLTVPGMGISGIKLNSEVFEIFLNFNLRELLNSMPSDEDEEEPADASYGPQNEEDDDPIIPDEEEEKGQWTLTDWLGLFDSVEFSKGQIAIVVAKTALQEILFGLLNIPFDNLGRVSLTLDNVANIVRFHFSLDDQPEIEVGKIGIGKLEEMTSLGKVLPAEVTSLDADFPLLPVDKLINSYTLTDKLGRTAYYMLFSNITPAQYNAYLNLFGNYTLLEDTMTSGVELYRFRNDINIRGAVARYNNGIVTVVVAEEGDFASPGRDYSLVDIEIGAISEMTPEGNIWPTEAIAELDASFPEFETELLQAFTYYDAEYGRDVICMLYDSITENMMRDYVNHIREFGYMMNRDSEGVYHLSKDSVRYILDEDGKVTGEIKVNVIAAVILFENGTMCVAVSNTTNKFNFNLSLANIDVKLGANNIFIEYFEPQGIDYAEFFENNFKPLTEYKWEFEVYSELTFDDSIGGLFDLTELTSSIFNMADGGSGGLMSSLGNINFALQPAEDIHIVIGFTLRIFIDFSDLNYLRFQLEVSYNGKQIALISYIGSVVDGEENSTIYADLSGLSLPAIKLENIQLTSIVKELMANMDFSTPEEPEEAAGPSNASPTVLPIEDRINLADIAFGNPLLLFTASKKEVSLAITGALAYSLIAGIPGNTGFRLPVFNNLKIGYSEEEGLAGIVIRLTDDTPYDQAFRIGYNFREGESRFATDFASAINPFLNAEGQPINYENVSTLTKIGLSLDMEMRIRTKKNGGEKSDQIEMLEAFIETLIGIDAGGVNLEPQDTVMVFGVQLKVFTNLANLTQTNMMINLTFNEESFMAIYYFAEKNLVYADLSGLGLFTTSINGIDLMSILGYMLNGVIEPDIGLDLTKLFGSATKDAAGLSNASGPDGLRNAATDLISATDAPIVRILLGNDEITINPNAAVLGVLLTGYQIPRFSDIRLSTNISYGLNNMNFRVKIDNYGNNISFNVAENMFSFAIGEAADSSCYKTPSSIVSSEGKFGAISGITLNAGPDGSMVFNMDTVAMLSTLMDTIKLSNMKVYLDKRNDYWYMRDLRCGIPEFSGTGPTYWGDDGAGYDEKVDALKFDIFGYELSFGTTFSPLYLSNAFRRTRLTLDKTNNNAINIRVEQLTQIAEGDPMTARAFISDNILRISLGSALTINLTPIIKYITEKLLEVIIKALTSSIPDIPGLDWKAWLAEQAAIILAPYIAQLIGDVTGYGNPLRLGQIIDEVTGGGIEVFRVFLPELLKEDEDDEDPFAFGSVYGKVTDKNGAGIPDARVALASDQNFECYTDKDGNYSFINLPAKKYEVSVSREGYNTRPLPGETKIYITIKSYVTNPALEANYQLDDYLEETFYNVTFRGYTRNAGGTPVGGVLIYLDTTGGTPIAVSDSNGYYNGVVAGPISGRAHTLITNRGQSVGVVILSSNSVITTNITITVPTTGTITGTFVVLKDERLITSSKVPEIIANAQVMESLQWNSNIALLDHNITLPAGGENTVVTKYYEAGRGIYYAVLTNIIAGEFENYRSIMDGKGYQAELVDNVYHSLNATQKVILEFRRLQSNNTLIVAIKAAGKTPVDSDFEVWLETGGRTIRTSDSFNGKTVGALLNSFDEGEDRELSKITPRDYITEGNAAKEKNITASGYFEIRDLALDTQYIFKIRSAKYVNTEFTVTKMQTTAPIAALGEIMLVLREKHWSQETEASSNMIQSIRLRLGADKVDANGNGTNDPTNPGYATDNLPASTGQTDGKGKPIYKPTTNYIKGYEGGATDNSNGITYVELWLNSDVLVSVFNMVNNFILPMIGISPISEDQRYTIADLAKPPSGTSQDDIKIYNYVGQFDESDDHRIYDNVYATKQDYLQALNGAFVKLPAGLISFAFNLAIRSVEFLQNQYVRMIIQYAAGALIDDQLDQVSRFISHLLPFTYPYSMSFEKDLPGSPLQQTAVTSTKSATTTTNVKTLIENEGILKNGVKTVTKVDATTPEVNDDGELLKGYYRDIDYFDMSAYIKVMLNNNVDAMIDRILLFINGASYNGAENGVPAADNWSPKCTILRADTIRYDETTGLPVAADKAMADIIENWIRKNIVNSYVVVSDYRYDTDELGITTKVLIGKTYIRDVYGNFDADDWQYGSNVLTGAARTAALNMSAKDDHYEEIDISNTGIRLRVVRMLASGNKFFNAQDTGSGPISRTTMEPPDMVIFHDPYNPKDFTAYGGTWASENAGVRHNLKSDGTYSVDSVLEILPNRNEATFFDGNSSASTGVYVYWDMTSVKFKPTEQDVASYIVGYCANAVYGKNSSGVITKIKAIVEGKMVVDPRSTLKLNGDGTQEVANTQPVLNPPEIDPYDFNRDEYIQKLPDMFSYAYKMQYLIDGAPQKFNIGGTTTYYIYKRYVFNNLKWDMSETELNYQGGTSYIKLTYGFTGSENITIEVPVTVKNREIIHVNADVANSVNGIVENKMVFNPLIHSNPKQTVTGVTSLDVMTVSGMVYGWRVLSVNAESLNSYDPQAIEHPLYTVYYTLEDSFGDTQTVGVQVEILSRRIVSSSLDNIGDFDEGDTVRTTSITPFNNDGLDLPDQITVFYQGTVGGVQISEILYEGEDFNWIIPRMSYNNGTADPTKIYTVTAAIGQGDNKQELYLYYKVLQRIPKSVKSIVIPPYGNTAVSNQQDVIFNDGSKDLKAVSTDVYFLLDQSAVSDSFTYEEVTIGGYRCKKDIEFTLPSFDGKFYYSDVLLYDPLFGTAVVKNVSIAIRMSVVTGLNKPEGADILINQYYSDRDIDNFLASSGLTLNILNATSKVTDSYFDILSWSYADEGGFFSNGEDAFINVFVGNEGYSENPIWKQEIRVDMSEYLEDLTIERPESYELVIADPYNFTLPETAAVIYRTAGVSASAVLPALYDLGIDADDFYKHDSVTGSVRIGNMPNNYVTYEITFINNNPRKTESIVYYKDAGYTEVFDTSGNAEFYALDNIRLPEYAKVTFESGEVADFNVYWYSIDEYGINGGAVTAEAWIGDPVFGYIKDEISFIVIGETIDYSSPDYIYLNPYKDFDEQIGVFVGKTMIVDTDKRQGVEVSVIYPEIPYSYSEQKEHGLYFEIGITTDFGSVGDIRKKQQIEHFGYEIRESFFTRFIVDSRVAIGVDADMTGSIMTGSIYEKIDFEALQNVAVLFENGSSQTMPVVWNTENLIYTFLGGVFEIYATIGAGTEGLEQTFPVQVFITPSQLVAIAAKESDEDNDILDLDSSQIVRKIKELKVDPFVGFVGLPTRVNAKFENVDRQIEVNVSWSYQKIVDVMPITGMRCDETNNLAAVATIYDYDSDGNRTAMQSLEIPVEVLDRTIISTQISKTTDQEDFELLAQELEFNPYEAAYSEDFNSENFAYYRRVRLTLKDGDGFKTLTFDLYEDNYLIRDNATMRKTNLTNLYTGRNITVNMTYRPEGNSISKEATITNTLFVRILDMSYESGLKDAYYVDVYGIKTSEANPQYYDPKYTQRVTYTDGEYPINTVSGRAWTLPVTYDGKDINTAFDSFDNRIGTIDYKAGTGRLYATFGNDFGGYQTIIIPVYYDERTVTQLFDKENTPHFGTFTTTAGIEREGFIFDPFAKYSVEENYPQSGNQIKFNTADGVTGSFDNSAANGIKVVWDDSKVKITYKGSEDGYVKATISADGLAPQTVYYRVKIMNRTVVDYTNVLKNDDYVIKPYDYNSRPDLSKAIADEIFMPAGTLFTVMFAEGAPISFRIGGYAGNYTTTDTVLLTPAEENIPITFNLDTSRSISFKGKDARFYIKIPGFAMGEEGQQMATYNIPCEEQYIIDVEFYDNASGNYYNYIDWIRRQDTGANDTIIKRNETHAAAGNRYVFDIYNPYYFIKTGGVPLPDKVKIYVGTAEGQVTAVYPNIDVNEDVETYWTSSRNNKANIYYNRDMISSSFQMDLDNQSFKMTFLVTPWVLDNTVVFNENYAYGQEEIILLPGASVLVNDDVTVGQTANPNDTYNVNFGEGRSTRFEGINGGGSYLNNYNKWSFDDVSFTSTEKQYAKLTLGGRGGQEIQWGFYVSEKELVNNTIPGSYTMLKGTSVTLPTTYRQLFSGGNYLTSKEYNIEYSELKNTEDEGRPLGISRNGNTINAVNMTPAKSVFEGDKSLRADNYAPAYVEWSATTIRAYPSTSEKIGGKIYFVCYDTPNHTDQHTGFTDNLTNYNSHMHHPDASFSYNAVKPGLDSNWQYPSDMQVSASATTAGDNFYTPTNPYYYNNSVKKLNSVPVIQVNQNTLFSSFNLPMLSLRWHRDRYYEENWYGGVEVDQKEINVDQIYTIPWEKAQVYWVPNARSLDSWNHAIGLYGTDINANPNIPDIYFINTGKDSYGNSRVYGRYTLVVKMVIPTLSAQGNAEYTLVVALDIVELAF